MTSRIHLGDIAVDVVFKEIKNIHLSVYPPNGQVRIAAPSRMNLDTIRIFAIAKLGWIKQQQKKIQTQEREPPREYLDRESHYVWGKRYLLQVVESDKAPSIELHHSWLILKVRPDADEAKKQVIVEEWYRRQLKTAIPLLIAKWEPMMQVKVAHFFVQRMKTRWGSCNPRAGTIRLNTDLAKKPPACLEYVVVHEMIHLLEPSHNSHFLALLDQFLPQWQFYREQLNQLPLSHADWSY